MSEKLFQLKVTLIDSEPPIWRRLIVPQAITLEKLHLVLQVVMGWTNSHLYQFRVGETLYGDPEDDEYNLGVRPAAKKRLSAPMKEGVARFVYEHDLGDSWEHDVVVEKPIVTDGYIGYPVCLEGERASPRSEGRLDP